MNILLSKQFKQEATKAIAAIVLFIIGYILLVSLTLAAALAIIGLAIKLIAIKLNFITLLLFGGSIMAAIMIVIFLFKFIFSSTKFNDEGLLEIQRKDHPKLYAIIDEIVLKVGTDFPKKVYLSNELNASVFYDSSFMSMFFPTRKNLHIGLSLVNLMSEDELKGILAHEFGHFAQRTMKVGSYIYNFNKIVYHMIYENDFLNEQMDKASNVHFIFTLCMLLAKYIMMANIYLLTKLFILVRKQYMALSRQMEFHADEVAANVVGSEVCINAFNKFEAGEIALNRTFSFLNNLNTEHKQVTNFYHTYTVLLHNLAKEKGYAIHEDSLYISQENVQNTYQKQIVVKNQWASHPTNEERIQALEKLNIPSQSISTKGAFNYFNDATALQETFTKHIYPEKEVEVEVTFLDTESIASCYNEFYKKNSFNASYNHYYDYKNPILEIDTEIEIPSDVTLQTLFDSEKLNLLEKQRVLQSDLDDLTEILKEENNIRSFDYNGIKYKRNKAMSIIKNLSNEMADIKKEIEKHDQLIFSYFKKVSIKQNKKTEFEDIYKKYIFTDSLYDEAEVHYKNISHFFERLQQDTVILESKKTIKKFSNQEIEFKNFLSKLMIHFLLKEEQIENLNKFIKHTQSYIQDENFNVELLDLLYYCRENMMQICSDSVFDSKKQLLETKLQLCA